MYITIHINPFISLHNYDVHVYAYVCMYVCECVCARALCVYHYYLSVFNILTLCVYVFVRMCTHVCMYVYVRTYVNVCVRMYVCGWVTIEDDSPLWRPLLRL